MIGTFRAEHTGGSMPTSVRIADDSLEVQAAFPRDRLPKRRLIMRRSGFQQKSAVDEFADAVFAGFNNSDAMPSR
jgi:hypothetical protein